MNYRTLAKAALALTLGFIVASASASTTTYTDTPLYGATFESATSAVDPLNDHPYATNTLVTAYTGTEGGATYGWLAGATDESKIIEAHGGQALQLNTDAGTLTNKLAPTAVATPFNNGIAADGAYIETEAKFVASDTLDPGVRGGTDDTKFALYAYCDEDAGTTTNLVVYHGVMDGNGDITYTNEIFATLINTEVYTKIRVEMKRLVDPEDTEKVFNVFSVKIGNEAPLSSDLSLDALFNGAATGMWFLTIEDPGEASAKRVSTINFKGTGEVDNLEVGTMLASTTYAVDWTASENVVVSNATAQLTNADTNFTAGATLSFYPTVGSITNVLVNGDEIDGVFYPLDGYTYTVGTADAVLTILAGVETTPPAPTVITVAQTIGGHGGSISNGNFQAMSGTAVPITITADQGYVVAQIVTNGAPVAGVLGQTAVTFDAVFSDAAGANNSIVATFAPNSAWFLDPFVRFTAGYGASANTFLASLSPDETSFFVGKSPSEGSGAVMFNVPTLLDNLDPAYSPLRNVAASEITDGAALRGGAASSELQLAIAGTLTVGSNWVIPFDGSAPYKVTHSIGAALDAMDFGANSAYLYAGAYSSGYRTKVYKLSFANNLANGDALTVEATYDVASAGIQRVRAICAEMIGGKEYVFVAGGDNSFQGVAVIDTTTGAVTRVLDVTLSGQPNQPMSIDIAGIADGTPRMYIGCLGDNSIGTSGFMNVYALSNDGLSAISTEPITTIPSSFLSAKAINVFSLDGETNAVACANASGTTRAYVIEKKPANLIVRGTFDQGVTTDDRSVAFGAAASETFNAPEGETLISVTVNGVAQQIAEGATSFTYEAAELTQYVYIDMQSVEPQYTATYTGSENVIVTNTYDGSSYEWGEGEAVVPTQIACLSGTVLSFYPTEGNVITNVTIGGVEQTGFDPACYTITVISDTNLVVLAGVQAPTTYTVSWAGSENVVVSNATEEILITSGEFEEGDVITFYPTEGSITNVLLNGAEQRYTTPFVYEVTADAQQVLLVYAGEAARIKPEWAEQADTTKFWAWVDANGVTDYANTDYTAQYLFNANPEETVINLRIVSIEVGANATTIVVSGQVGRGIAKLNEINGVLSVATGSSPTALTPKAIPTAITYDENGDATITIPAGNGSFFRARVDFAAPSTSLVTAE